MGSVGASDGVKKVYYATVVVLGKRYKLCFADGGLVVSLHERSLREFASSVPLFFWKQEAQVNVHKRKATADNSRVLEFDDGTTAKGRGNPHEVGTSEFRWVRVA
jgi:hypothetical protein